MNAPRLWQQVLEAIECTELLSYLLKISRFLDKIESFHKRDIEFWFPFEDGQEMVIRSHAMLDSICQKKVLSEVS